MLINMPDPPEKNIYSSGFRCSINIDCLMLLELMSLLTFYLLIIQTIVLICEFYVCISFFSVVLKVIILKLSF